MGDNALLNAILRVYFSAADYNVLNPAAQPPTEIDHFWEVQHIVNIIRPEIGDNWYPMAIGEFMDLASFVNEHRNMFRITAADNQAKKAIPLNQYPTNQFIRAYLDRRLQGAQYPTVQGSVQALVRAMRDRVSTYPRLTRLVGARLCDLMGW